MFFSYLTCVSYQSLDRFEILDKKDFSGSPIKQIENALLFLQRHTSSKIQLDASIENFSGQRKNLADYPVIALREAIINAVSHRDYYYDASHIYIHLFPDRLEIENPGGLYHGLTLDTLGKRSVRRNRLITDMLHRAGFIERVGSGFPRMEQALKDNNNPPLKVSANNFFIIQFQKRLATSVETQCSPRQLQILNTIKSQQRVNKKQLANYFNLSDDTILNELKTLLELGLVERHGQGKATFYSAVINHRDF